MNSLIYTIIDILMLLIVLYSAIIGYIRGMWRSTIYFVSWLLIIYVTYYAFYFLHPFIEKNIGSGILYSIISLIIIGGLICILFTWFAEFSTNRINNSNMLNWLDDLLGLLFGATRGWAILMVAWLIVKPFLLPEQIPEIQKSSNIVEKLDSSLIITKEVFPEFATTWLTVHVWQPLQENSTIKKLLPDNVKKAMEEQFKSKQIVEVNSPSNEENTEPVPTTPPQTPDTDKEQLNNNPPSTEMNNENTSDQEKPADAKPADTIDEKTQDEKSDIDKPTVEKSDAKPAVEKSDAKPADDGRPVKRNRRRPR